MLEASNLTYSYPKQANAALSNISLGFAPGGIYGLLGANGTGKSTLLYCLCGLLKPQSGVATLNGTNTFERKVATLSEMFIVPEEFDMPPVELSEYVKMNAPFYPNFSAEDMERYLEHFRLTPDIHLGRLSMGQRKKAFVAFALACNTSVLLMDEPTNGLDIPGKSEFRRAVVSAMNENRTIIISTHQVRDLDRVLDHVVMISKQGVVLNASLASIQQKLRFRFSGDPADCEGALWSSPVVGGYASIHTRPEGADETDVNLEALFEFAYINPETAKAL